MNPSDLNLLSSFVRSVAKSKLTALQLTMLTTIGRNPGITLNGICKQIGIQYSKDSYRPLVNKGLVVNRMTTRARFRTGPRTENGLHLTPLGFATLERLIESIRVSVQRKEAA